MSEEKKGPAPPALTERLESFATNTQRTANQAIETVGESLQQTTDGISQAVKQTSAAARDEYGKAYKRSLSFIDTAYAHYKATEDEVVEAVKDAAALAAVHKNKSIAGATALALIVLPGPRRFLWRRTFGRLESLETRYESQAAKAKGIAEAVEGQTAEAGKLESRLQAAMEQYTTGLSKLKATKRQLVSLTSQVKQTEKASQAVLTQLREIPTKDALALRSEVATLKAAAKRQRDALDAHVWKLEKKLI